MWKNEDYATRNLFDYLYHQKYYKIIGIGLSRETNTSIRQQINFTEKSEKDDGAAILFVPEKQQQFIFNTRV